MKKDAFGSSIKEGDFVAYKDKARKYLVKAEITNIKEYDLDHITIRYSQKKDPTDFNYRVVNVKDVAKV